MDSDRKCKFHRFCPARSDCNNIAHAILSCYKLQGAFNQFTEKVWKFQMKYIFLQAWSEEILRFDLYLHIKIHQIAWKNFQNADVNRAKKAYQCVVYTPIKVTDGHKPTGISVAFIHQHLKENAIPRVCLIALLWMIVCIFLKLDQDLLLTVQTSFVYPLRWGFQVLITTEWRIVAELS